jgi:hypothetical protein
MTVAELKAEEARHMSALAETDSIASELRLGLDEIKKQLARRLKPAPEPRISDHAFIRYMERKLGVDVDAIRKEILTDRVKEALRLGATGYTVNGVKFKAQDGVLVTVLKSWGERWTGFRFSQPRRSPSSACGSSSR